jgi:flavin-dependent dehydrogenase
MKIGIIGARLAGSYAAMILAKAGHEVLLIDHATAGEKACGGGLTAKVIAAMPFLGNHSLPGSEIRSVELTTCSGDSAEIQLSRPMHVFSRAALDEFLRCSAIKAGARFYPERAIGYGKTKDGWIIRTSSNEYYEVHFLVGADGAASSVRAHVSEKLASSDLSLALGYYLPGSHHPDKVVIEFQEAGFPGYLWSFPRIDHASIGIIRRLPGTRTHELRQRVTEFISFRHPGIPTAECSFFTARVPCLGLHTLRTQRVCGRTWALLGDAAGFVDAITSEGIYFALRSAEILGEALHSGSPMTFESRWRSDFGAALERAASWRDRFYDGSFMRRPFTERMVHMSRRCRTIRRIADAIISGFVGYPELRSRLLKHSPRILAEYLGAILLRA